MGRPHHPSPESRRLGTIREAAEIGLVSTKTVRRLIDDGELTSYRLGSRVIRVDLDEFQGLFRRSETDHKTSTSTEIAAKAIEAILAVAPPLSDEQRTAITRLLQPSGQAA